MPAGAGAGAGAEEDAARSGKQKSGMYARFSSESMGADERDASGGKKKKHRSANKHRHKHKKRSEKADKESERHC